LQSTRGFAARTWIGHAGVFARAWDIGVDAFAVLAGLFPGALEAIDAVVIEEEGKLPPRVVHEPRDEPNLAEDHVVRITELSLNVKDARRVVSEGTHWDDRGEFHLCRITHQGCGLVEAHTLVLGADRDANSVRTREGEGLGLKADQYLGCVLAGSCEEESGHQRAPKRGSHAEKVACEGPR
jgi:hypothetical protein